MSNCPNCGSEVPGEARLCPSCGFDTEETQAEDVRELREEGKIDAGLCNPEHPEVVAGDDATADAHDTELPAEGGSAGPRETQGGL
jgi:hypothetical protein